MATSTHCAYKCWRLWSITLQVALGDDKPPPHRHYLSLTSIVTHAMFSAKFLSLALLVTGALAVPSAKTRLADRRARRAAGTHLSRPLQLVEDEFNVAAGNTSDVSYSSNWSGAVLSQAAVSDSGLVRTK